MKVALCGLAAVLLVALPLAAKAEKVTVFAAASLQEALDRIAEDFTKRSGHEVAISYAGSNALAKQILQGAPADLFLSAAENWMDEVEKEGLIVAETRLDLLGNDLVLIAHGTDMQAVTLDKDTDFKTLLGGGRLAMGLVDAVPAGQYGKAALESLGLWEAVAPSVAESDNVRAALALVALGEAPYGITYGSDARAEPSVSIVATFPPESHPPIRYPLALLTSAEDDADRAFYEALQSSEARKVFAEAGFTMAPLPAGGIE